MIDYKVPLISSLLDVFAFVMLTSSRGMQPLHINRPARINIKSSGRRGNVENRAEEEKGAGQFARRFGSKYQHIYLHILPSPDPTSTHLPFSGAPSFGPHSFSPKRAKQNLCHPCSARLVALPACPTMHVDIWINSRGYGRSYICCLAILSGPSRGTDGYVGARIRGGFRGDFM